MATVRDVVNGALRRLGVLDVSEDAEAEVAAVALAAYNAMHAEAYHAGWIAGTWTDLGLNDTAAIGPAYAESAKAAVAVRIAPDYGREVGRRLALDGARWMAMVAAANPPKATFERGFRCEDVDQEYGASV